MKLSIFIVFLIGMAGCTSPQAPVLQRIAIAGLSIPDTVDFGIVGNGLTVDSSVSFQNIGMDTIHISSQGFNDSSFKLVESKWTSFNIGPGTTQHIGIQFTAADTNQLFGLDTIRSSNSSNIMVLRGKGNTFSSLFPSAPTSVNVLLSGLIGNYQGPAAGVTVDYYFATNTAPQQWSDTLHFSSTYSSCSSDGSRCDAGSVAISFHIDTTLKWIDWLEASSYNQVTTCQPAGPDGPCLDGTTTYTTTMQRMVISGIQLSRDSIGWSGSISGSSISSAVDSLSDLQNFDSMEGSYTEDQLISVTGYTPTAVLSVSIH